MDKDKIIMYAPEGELQDSVRASGVLDISDLSRKQTKELAKTAAGWAGEDGTFSWRDVASGQADIQGKTPRQEKRFKRIFNKQLSENLSPILERQHKQELIDRMKSGDASAMSQWTSEGINKFGYQFMPVMLTAATLPFGIGAFGQSINTIGLLPTIGMELGSWGLGYGGYKLGSYLDDDFGTKWIAPTLSIAGGFGGAKTVYKGWEGAVNRHIINNAFKSGQLKWGPPTSYTAYHQSATPTTKFKFPFKRWDVRTHGADPNGAFFTVGKPAGSGFLAERPYTGQFQVKVQKPLIQTGELTGPTKNGLRNAIVRHARKNGADAVFFDGIADNTLQNQQILFAMDNADIGYRGMVGTPFKQGNWQLPRGVRNQPYNPTATERVFSVLGRDPNVPTGGISDPYAFEKHRSLQPMYNFLKQHGVNVRNITLGDLDNLYAKRLHAIRSTSNNNYNVAIPDGASALPSNWKILGYDPEGLVGEMSFTGRQNSPGASVKMIRNTTRPDGPVMYDPTVGWIQTTDVTRSPVSGVSQRLYDAGIPTAQQTNNGSGLMSGELYLQAQRSTAVMDHYPTKKIIRNDGTWNWENRDPIHATTWNNPVYLLTQPSGRYTHIPTKSTSFFPSAIKDGQITTNINHGSIFLEDGGKIENPDR